MGAIATVGTPEALVLFRRVILASAAIPVVFPPVYLPVRAGGRDHDEMHVDGGTTAEIVLFGDAIDVPKLTAGAQLPVPRRTPVLYAIRNAKLGPEEQDVRPQVVDIAGRALSTLTKNQSAGDLFRIYEVANHNGFAFRLAAIPDELRLPKGSGFDHAVLQALFEYGHDQGRAAFPWRSQPPMADEAVNALPDAKRRGGGGGGGTTRPG